VPASGCVNFDYGETEDYCVSLVIGPTAITEQGSASDIRIFPIPADGSLTVTSSRTGALVLVLSDATGRTIVRQRMAGGRATVDTQRLGNGLYHLQLLDGSNSVARRNVMVVH
jgi:hypothetical protein